MNAQTKHDPGQGRRPDPAMRKQAIGAWGERVAQRHLLEQGLILLDRNWRSEPGEIDLVLREGQVLVMCEVKTRSSTNCGTPHEALTQAKVERMHRLAGRWLTERGLSPREVRFDLVAVLRRRTGAPIVEHIRGVG